VAGTNPVAVQRPGAEARLAAAEGWPAAEVESEAGAEGVEVAVAVAVEVAVEVAVVRLLRDRWVRRDRSWIRS
jgi:hypothetical protein